MKPTEIDLYLIAPCMNGNTQQVLVLRGGGAGVRRMRGRTLACLAARGRSVVSQSVRYK